MTAKNSPFTAFVLIVGVIKSEILQVSFPGTFLFPSIGNQTKLLQSGLFSQCFTQSSILRFTLLYYVSNPPGLLAPGSPTYNHPDGHSANSEVGKVYFGINYWLASLLVISI